MMPLKRFDTDALFEALEARRVERGLTWTGVAREFWELDAALNAARPNDHPFSAATITRMKARRRTSCQHALFMLRWLDRAPEHFLEGGDPSADDIALPSVEPGKRLRWSLKRLHGFADTKRKAEGMSWKDAAATLGCTANQLTGLNSAKFATNIDLAMRIVQWVGRPSPDFMYLASW